MMLTGLFGSRTSVMRNQNCAFDDELDRRDKSEQWNMEIYVVPIGPPPPSLHPSRGNLYM
jgi:hypothetical protein